MGHSDTSLQSPTDSSLCFGSSANTEAGARPLPQLSSLWVLGAAKMQAAGSFLQSGSYLLEETMP